MKIWLQTRGVVQDYAFLGTVIPDVWWSQSIYGEATSFEFPTLILEQHGAGKWRGLISGLPSTRHDRARTPIRYTLALQGTPADQDLLLKLIGYVLSSFRTSPVNRETHLTKLLDEAVGDRADEWLEAGKEKAQECVDGLAGKIAELPPMQIDDELADEIKALIAGAPGSARAVALLNFISAREDPSAVELQASLSPSQGRVLLLPSPVAGGRIEDVFSVRAPVAAPKSGQTSGHGHSGAAGTERSHRMTLAIAIGIILVLLAGFMIWYNVSSSNAAVTLP